MKRKIAKNKKSKVKNIVYDIILLLLFAVIVFCAYKVISYYAAGHESKELNSELAAEVVEVEPNQPVEEVTEPDETTNKPVVYKKHPIPKSINFASLTAKNSHTAAWLFNQNGVINYPVMFSGENNYYINHLIDGSKNAAGSLFVEARNSPGFVDTNTIIYGHSMQNGTMFGTLLRYAYQGYYNAYPEFYLYTPEANYRVDIVAAYYTDTTDIAYGTNPGGAIAFSNAVRSKSRYKTNVTVNEGDRFLTLSTCAYTSDDARFVVVGKLVNISAAPTVSDNQNEQNGASVSETDDFASSKNEENSGNPQ